MTTPKQPAAGPSASLSEALTGKEGLGAPIREAPEPGGTLTELMRREGEFPPNHLETEAERLAWHAAANACADIAAASEQPRAAPADPLLAGPKDLKRALRKVEGELECAQCGDTWSSGKPGVCPDCGAEAMLPPEGESDWEPCLVCWLGAHAHSSAAAGPQTPSASAVPATQMGAAPPQEVCSVCFVVLQPEPLICEACMLLSEDEQDAIRAESDPASDQPTAGGEEQ